MIEQSHHVLQPALYEASSYPVHGGDTHLEELDCGEGGVRRTVSDHP